MAVAFDAPYGYDLVEIPSNPSVSSSTNIGGNNIRFVNQKIMCTSQKYLFLRIQLQVMVDEAGTARTLL